MQGRGRVAHVQHAVQHAARLVRRAHAQVLVAVRDDRILGQYGVAMVAIGVDGVAAIGIGAPQGVGQELVLRDRRPARVARRVPLVFAQHFLQEHEIRPCLAQGLAQFVQDETAVEAGEAFVCIDGQDPEPDRFWRHEHSGRRDAAAQQTACPPHDGAGTTLALRWFPMVRARPKETTMSATLRCHVPPKPDPIPPDSPPGDLPVDPDTDDPDIDLPPPDAPGGLGSLPALLTAPACGLPGRRFLHAA
ncbi:Uncharacterised protein [Bordetella pertussis]|nr:Uncharacterised protein [Bordetella pertussis]CPK04215.1 Uncharacterised protein [Bordetella pertussis]CPN90556.1 Uncharacterised protein [Bordetella pertussis]CPO48980.1 Uncharacterised protein [Bordetella pertussis]